MLEQQPMGVARNYFGLDTTYLTSIQNMVAASDKNAMTSILDTFVMDMPHLNSIQEMATKSALTSIRDMAATDWSYMTSIQDTFAMDMPYLSAIQDIAATIDTSAMTSIQDLWATITASQMHTLSQFAIQDLSEAGSDVEALTELDHELEGLDERRTLSDLLSNLGSMQQRAVLILSLNALVLVAHYVDAETGVSEPPHLILLVQALLAIALATNMYAGTR
jgi:hypothetical protein